MKYHIEFTSSAQREFLRLSKTDRERIGVRIDALADNRRPHGCVKLSGAANLWRIRIGDYRVIYSVDDKPMIVAITKVALRRDVYRGM